MMQIPEFGDTLFEFPTLCPHKKRPAKIETVYAYESPIRLNERVHFKRIGSPPSPSGTKCSECHRRVCCCVWEKLEPSKRRAHIEDSDEEATIKPSPQKAADHAKDTKRKDVATTVNASTAPHSSTLNKSRKTNQSSTKVNGDMIWIKKPISDLKMSSDNIRTIAGAKPSLHDGVPISSHDITRNLELKKKASTYCCALKQQKNVSKQPSPDNTKAATASMPSKQANKNTLHETRNPLGSPTETCYHDHIKDMMLSRSFLGKMSGQQQQKQQTQPQQQHQKLSSKAGQMNSPKNRKSNSSHKVPSRVEPLKLEGSEALKSSSYFNATSQPRRSDQKQSTPHSIDSLDRLEYEEYRRNTTKTH